MSKWKNHKEKWEKCRLCDYCETRKNVVLYRGVIPCDILVIGEAPGDSEDVLGKPFVGPAGKLLDYILEQSIPNRYKIGITNAVACIPKDEDKNKIHTPDTFSIKKCRERVKEIIKIAKPNYLILVGVTAKLSLLKIDTSSITKQFEIKHPAYVLRQNIAQQNFLIQQAITTIAPYFIGKETNNAEDK